MHRNAVASLPAAGEKNKGTVCSKFAQLFKTAPTILLTVCSKFAQICSTFAHFAQSLLKCLKLHREFCSTFANFCSKFAQTFRNVKKLLSLFLRRRRKFLEVKVSTRW